MEEKFDVLNEYGEFTGKVKTRTEVHEKGLEENKENAIKRFEYYKKNRDRIIEHDEILLQKRSRTKKNVAKPLGYNSGWPCLN